MRATALSLIISATAVRLPRSMDNSEDYSSTNLLNDAAFPDAQFVTQPQDHFDSSNTNTWQQAFFVNDTFWKAGSDAPIFLCVGGEGPPLDGSAVQNSVHCNVAVEFLQENKALMFAIEHRYYGCHNTSACPYDTSKKQPAADALKFLSSKQAVEDVANFHAFASKKWGLEAGKNKWVSFGGSYPGMLASFVRMKHPELIHASIASSAPVHAAVDMPGYNDVTAQAYGLESVGGSTKCNGSIANGHAKIGQMFNTSDGRAQLKKLFPHRIFTADSLTKRSVQADFAGNGVAEFPAQSNDPTCTRAACNIEGICKIMTDDSLGDDVAKLAKLSTAQAEWASNKAVDTNTDTTRELDYWGYQTCAEFGFYQTCELGSQCMYTQGLVLLEDYTSMCPTAFDISVEQISANIAATNKYYGGVDPIGPDNTSHNVSRIMWPNGDVDPWHALSVLVSPADEKEMPVLMVSGASHHAWTHPSSPDDQASVVAARQTIREQVAAWLKEN